MGILTDEVFDNVLTDERYEEIKNHVELDIIREILSVVDRLVEKNLIQDKHQLLQEELLTKETDRVKFFNNLYL